MTDAAAICNVMVMREEILNVFRTTPTASFDTIHRRLADKFPPAEIQAALEDPDFEGETESAIREGLRTLPGTPAGRQGLSASSLVRMHFDAASFIVENLLLTGLSVLAGKPKLGKSWLALLIALCVAGGRKLWGRDVAPGRVAFLALEDNARRLKERLLLIGGEIPDQLEFFLDWERQGAGGVEELGTYLDQHPGTKLIIIDTLQRFRARQGKANAYEADYNALGELHGLTVKRGVSVLCLHHTRKGGADDVLDTLNGSTGIPGACDSTLVLTRARGAADGTLYITGRDIDEQSLALNFDGGVWNLLGDTATVCMHTSRKAILEAVQGNITSMRPGAIAKAAGLNEHTCRNLLFKMVTDGQLKQGSEGYYMP